uniref:Zinc finger protein 865 n=1 Tax=Clastoptera arizonana TaxID=38151 RepID=A0A1B6BYQ0_9HEMI
MMTADSEKNSIQAKSSTCLICDASVGVSTRNSCPIFLTNVTSSDKPVSKIIGFLLGLEIVEDIVHSVLVCKKCLKLFNEVDELQERLAEIRHDVNTNYQRTIRKYEDNTINEDNTEKEKAPLQYSDCQKNKLSKRTRKSSVVIPTQAKNICDSDEAANRKINSEKESNSQENSVEITGKEITKKVDLPPEEIALDEEDIPTTQAPTAVLVEDDGQDDLQRLEDDEVEVQEVRFIQDISELTSLPGNVATLQKSVDGSMQIKLEVPDAEITDRPPIKKGIGRPRKRKSLSDRSDISSLIPQMVVSRDAAIYTCLLCSAEDKFMSDDKGICAHMKDCHSLRLYICDMCGQEFLKRNALSAHLDEHVANEEGDFQCEICNRIFNNLRLYRVHKRMHYPQVKNWTCDQCGKRYLSRNMLEEHMNTHTGVRPYQCSNCGKSFASKYTFKAHEKTHQERPRPFSCEVCSKTFLTQQNLSQHERTHSSARNYVCPSCGKGFGSARNLEVHCVVHSGFKSFICRMCGKAFARKAEIRDHERTHTGEKPYQCEFCGATFSQRSNLQSHKRATHYDDKRYKCMECGKGFKRRRLLDYHVKAAHTGERPYKCPTCSATFIYPEHFKKHRRIHTGEKPFRCEVCGKAFNSRDNRNAHRFVHSDKKPYECLVCGMGFMRKPLLYNHMQTQGHMNDTIVVNQPRLGCEEDGVIIPQVTAEGMEMTLVTDSEGNTKLMPADQVDSKMYIADAQDSKMFLTDEHDAKMFIDGNDTKMYIAELKEHVIIHKDRSNNATVISEGDEIVEGAEYEEAVEHLIIDGQVHFANPNAMEALDSSGNEITSVTEITTSLEEGHTIVVPTSRHGPYAEQQTTTVQTNDGPVHLLQIRIPTEGDNGQTWFNIVPS